MTNRTKSLPGFWHFVWLFFMQPVTLQSFLDTVGLSADQANWNLVRRPNSQEEDWWLRRSAQTLFTPICALLLLSLLLRGLGAPTNWRVLAPGLAIGVAFGVAGGVAAGVAVAIAGGVVFGGTLGVAVSSALGLAAGAAFGTTWEANGRAVFGIVFGLTLAAIVGAAAGATAGAAAGAAFFISYLRIPIYILAVISHTTARFWNGVTGRGCLICGSRPIPQPELLSSSLPQTPNPGGGGN